MNETDKTNASSVQRQIGSSFVNSVKCKLTCFSNHLALIWKQFWQTK